MADLMPALEVARECKWTLRHAYTKITEGVFGSAIGKLDDNSLGVERSAVEKYLGRRIEPKPRIGRGRPPKNDELEAAAFAPFALADLKGICRVAAETSDQRWRVFLNSRGIDLEPPPLPDELLVKTLKSQRFYTQQQVYELLGRTAQRRDFEWQCWLDDPLARAQLPKGPPIFNADSDLDPNK